jgi:hypothetical protein
MNKTLLLSMIGSMSLVLAACGDKGGTTTASTAATGNTTNGDGDGDTDTGDSGDGDGDPGDGDSDTTMSSSGITSQGFVPTSDIPDIAECDPFLQDCPDGEKCVGWGSTGAEWDSTKCVPVLGDKSEGDTCIYNGTLEATDDCGPDTYCWDVMDVDGVQQGVCTSFCEGTPDDPICPPDTSCLIANNGSINLCILTCDPILQDCENEGIACYWANNGFNCIFSTQDIPAGEPCGYINDCLGGLICLDATVLPACNGSACCGEYCDLSNPVCTQQGVECSAFFEEGMAPPGYEQVGVCILPGA